MPIDLAQVGTLIFGAVLALGASIATQLFVEHRRDRRTVSRARRRVRWSLEGIRSASSQFKEADAGMELAPTVRRMMRRQVEGYEAVKDDLLLLKDVCVQDELATFFENVEMNLDLVDRVEAGAKESGRVLLKRGHSDDETAVNERARWRDHRQDAIQEIVKWEEQAAQLLVRLDEDQAR